MVPKLTASLNHWKIDKKLYVPHIFDPFKISYSLELFLTKATDAAVHFKQKLLVAASHFYLHTRK